jgi:hypothetical protein
MLRSVGRVIRLDAATVLLQWAAGIMLFGWVTTRHRLISLGYGWLLRGTSFVLALGALACAVAFGSAPVLTVSAGLTALACGLGLAVSIARRRAGVSGQQAEHDRRSERVAAMTGIERTAGAPAATATREPVEFHPGLDLLPPLLALPGLLAGALDAGGPAWLSVLRVVVGAAFLGAITDAMLLGHWYLVQPGLPRRLLHELVDWNLRLWPAEVLVFLPSPGMIQVLNGTIDDGWNGLLGWTWLACAVTTLGLVIVTKAALKERQYSAVMAATGLLYLAILTAFGMDLIARAVLA